MPLTFRSLLKSRLLLAAASLSLLPAPALAQKTIEGRVDKLEKEMNAVQRKVFPGATGQIVAPDVTPEATQVQPVGSPASAPIADLTARVAAIESQVARLTGQVEENDHRLRQVEEANKALTSQIQTLQQAQAKAAEQAAAAEVAALPPPPAATLPGKAVAPRGAAVPPPKVAPTKAPPATVKSDAARTQAVAAIEHPSTGKGAQDGYTYGFRLWTAKFYPEAAAQLEDVVAKYPNDPVASRAANLLGRAYLEDGKPTQAAKTLFENYRTRPKGDRAAESLAWTGEALLQLNRPKDACLAYEELNATFGTTMPAAVRDMMTKGRIRAKCGG